ncbi:hypothetical protein [Blastomonas sp.]|uniref:hypothetical protein n=1 Tax=Blastomonas sp. TaxID=1909299 RepID=UPI003593E285
MAETKLTTQRACKLAGLHRDRFNEHVHADHYPCAPKTVPGRSRLFDANDLLALLLFRKLMDDGVDAKNAGEIACTVMEAARQAPSARCVAFVQPVLGSALAMPADELPDVSAWDDWLHNGCDIEKVTIFRVGKWRDQIAHQMDDDLLIVGDPSEG